MRLLKAFLAGLATFAAMVLIIALARTVLDLQFNYRWPMATSVALDIAKLVIPIIASVQVYKKTKRVA